MPIGPHTGQLAANVAHFGRLLRGVGLPADTGRVLEACRALSEIDVTDKAQFYWALHAVFTSKHTQHELFDEAFALFWRDPQSLDNVLMALLPTLYAPFEERRPDVSRRLADALARQHRVTPPPPEREQETPIEIDAALTWSDTEILQHKDFEQMSEAEVQDARKQIARMQLAQVAVPTRRWEAWARGTRVDARRSLRATLRAGPDTIPLRFRRRRSRPPPLVVLCDISGSMARYSRILLHFLHALTTGRERVHTFLFGTRLTNVTRDLRHRDVDVALAQAGDRANDWEGGTRIGACLSEFSRHWSRRVLSQGAWVLLITDGLDRDDGTGLDFEMARLRRSCRRLIWLNPLLRFAGFEPRAAGIKAMLPHVDDFRPCHDLASLATLAQALDARP